eukprot:TRINITY_DN45656_c0_g1_i1.p1 TRINITY_DN45656_c0_g1~~TRINITY_DN45656_c0_g1_i1.p1  ORF type:complete len:148 (-),score=3.95 TRINITY_DN45656_c0_g1_i1:256-699(-)
MVKWCYIRTLVLHTCPGIDEGPGRESIATREAHKKGGYFIFFTLERLDTKTNSYLSHCFPTSACFGDFMSRNYKASPLATRTVKWNSTQICSIEVLLSMQPIWPLCYCAMKIFYKNCEDKSDITAFKNIITLRIPTSMQLCLKYRVL